MMVALILELLLARDNIDIVFYLDYVYLNQIVSFVRVSCLNGLYYSFYYNARIKAGRSAGL
ncbi:hypothetical protein NQU36_26350, partial [Escherichia coli]|nr:hypothetical protein [Escherichia coli]